MGQIPRSRKRILVCIVCLTYTICRLVCRATNVSRTLLWPSAFNRSMNGPLLFGYLVVPSHRKVAAASAAAAIAADTRRAGIKVHLRCKYYCLL